MLIGIRNQIRLATEITFFQGRFTAQRNGFQVAAIRKRITSNAGDAVWNRDAGQAGAIIKHSRFNTCDTVWNGNAF